MSKKARFLERKNRFVASVIYLDREIDVYVPNTGRLKELLFKGNEVLLTEHKNSHRKYPYSISEVRKDDYFLSIDSTLANRLIQRDLEAGLFGFEGIVQKEVPVCNHTRLDFLVGHHHYIEVKSVTLDINGVALFPDAPTKRGIKHLECLFELKNKGFESHLIYVIFTKSLSFSIAKERTAYKEAFLKARDFGVKVHALRYEKKEEHYLYQEELPIII